MLAANELRIGNWIEYEGKQYQVHSPCLEFPILDTIEYGVGATDWKYANGIPLTPEILLACGFELFEYNDGRCTGYQHRWSKDMFRGFMAADDIFAILDYTSRHFNIQYLHQLQNVFYSLTQEELTYNPLKK